MTQSSTFLMVAGACAALTLTACSTFPAGKTAEAPQTLIGTWQLVQFVPNGGATPVKPDAADRYEITFVDKGRVALKVDCNRATAIWETTPTDGTHGSLSFGPMAMTRMACPTPALDTGWELNANSVANYAVVGDNLVLGLKDGKGTYEWARKKD